MNREKFLKSLGLITIGGSILPTMLSSCTSKSSVSDSGSETRQSANNPGNLFFKISLAEWSLHRTIFSGEISHLDFPLKAKNDFGIMAVEYVNQFFMDKAQDKTYLAELKKRCDDNGIISLLIMCDREGDLGNTDKNERMKAVENHYKWVEAASFLGCHSIRVNARGNGTSEEVGKAAAEGLHALSDFAKDFNLNVIVENHGGLSSNGKWLSDVMKSVNLPNCGTLPDFGNFCIKSEDGKCVEEYDRYQGVTELMPFAKGVSAKTHLFDDQGNCVETDYSKIMAIVKKSGYSGYVGVEYEGDTLSEDEGIMATVKLLEKVGREIS